MVHLVNLARNEEKSLIIDASALSIFIDTVQPDTNKRNVTFHLTSYEPKHGPMCFDKGSWNLDISVCIQNLAAAGHDFFELPYIWGDKKYYGEAYINPDAVSAIITSAPFTPENETEPHVAALIDVNGYGRFETYRVPESLIDALATRIIAKRPWMDRIDPSVARARFYEPGSVLYDPRQVNGIYQNGYDIDITFADTHRIDFRLAARKSYEDDPKLRESFAAAVAARGEGLVKLDAVDTYYTKLDDIVSVFRFDSQLQFTFRKGSRITGDTAHFENAQKAQTELERILAMSTPRRH